MIWKIFLFHSLSCHLKSRSIKNLVQLKIQVKPRQQPGNSIHIPFSSNTCALENKILTRIVRFARENLEFFFSSHKKK